MSWWPENLSEWIVIISGIATAVLVIIVGIQLAITKKELDSRLRPWIDIGELRLEYIFFKGGAQMKLNQAVKKIENDEKAEPETSSYLLRIKNVGKLPTYAMYTELIANKEIKIEEIEQSKDKKLYDHSFLPGSEDTLSSEFSYNDLEEGKKEFYYGILVEYLLKGKTKSKIAKIWQVEIGGVRLVETWIKDPDFKSDYSV